MAGLTVGTLDREVTIEAMSEAASGYPVESWHVLDALVWMSKQDLRGNERFLASQVSATFDTKWTMQWRDDMDPDAYDVTKTRRLLYRGRTFDIVQAVEIGRREGIVLMTIASGSNSSIECAGSP